MVVLCFVVLFVVLWLCCVVIVLLCLVVIVIVWCSYGFIGWLVDLNVNINSLLLMDVLVFSNVLVGFNSW